MPDYIGRIAVPEIVPSGTFPIVPDYPHGRAWRPDVAIHQFGSGNAKIEQRFLLGTGARRFTVRKAYLRETDRVALRNFWEAKYGPYGAFTYNAPTDDGAGTTPYVCRFANEPLSWEMVADHVSTVGVTLIEISAAAPTYALAQTVTRFPTAALETALLDQAQQLIPLIRIQPLEPGCPAIYVSDRRCTVGGRLYQARLLAFEGIEQSMGGEADEATFTFGNADRVMRELANDVDLFRASIEFSLFHVGTGVKLDLWKGDIVNWSLDAGPEFKVTAADGLYELNLPYPTRKISRTCNKVFNDGLACPYASEGARDLVHFPNASASACDKGYDTPNGCLAHGMKRRFGAVLVEPQGVRVKDNSTGTWGFGRSTLTSVSLVAESIYDEVVPEIYTDSSMPVNCKIAAGRDESDFYEAMGIVGEGPIGAFGVGHKLDDQYHHGYPGFLGLRTVRGTDPAGATDFFSLDQSGNQTAGDWRKVYSGNSTYKDNFAAGTAFVVIRRSDAKGLQLSKLGEHQMQAVVTQGLAGWVWTAPGACSLQVLTNPVWIAVNAILRARGLRFTSAGTAAAVGEQYFDVNAAVAAASVCNEVVESVITPGYYETQFRFRGVIQEEKPLRDWLQEILMNCLGYYTFAFGKLKLGVRNNSSAAEAFTAGNILFRSLELAPLKPSFNHLTANFADAEFEFVNNSLTLYDIDHATLVGGSRPLFLKSNVNLCGTATKSQAARIVTARLREELGGITAAEWKRARQVSFKTTVLALNVEPGMVCSMTHPDMPGGAGEFRVTGWKLNPDYSIEIQGRTTTDSMYDLVAGPKPADVAAEPVPTEPQNPVPGDIRPIGADAFLFTKTEDGVNANYTLEYDPPEPVGVFQGVTLHVESPDASRQIVFTQDFDYNGDIAATGVARHGTCQFSVPQSTEGAYGIRMYLASRSRAYKVPLVFAGDPVSPATPNRADTVSAGTGLGDPGDAPNVKGNTSARVWYRDNQTGRGRVFGFEGNVVPPDEAANFGGCEIYLHWITGFNPDGSPVYQPEYITIEHTGPEGGPWHANDPGLDLAPGFDQWADIVFVSRNRHGIENAKAGSFTIRLRVEEGGAQTPDTPVGSTARVVYEYITDKGWYYGFAGAIVEPVDKTNYAGTKVFIKWEMFPEYTECWDSRTNGGLDWKTYTWPLPPNDDDAYIRLYFVPYNQRGELMPFEQCPFARVVRESQANPTPPDPNATSTANVWYKYIEGRGWVFGFEGNVVPPADTSNFGGVEIYVHWIEGWNPDGTPIYDPRYLAIEHTGRGGGPWHASEPGGYPLTENYWDQQVDVIFVTKDARQVENPDKESCFKVRLKVDASFLYAAPDVALFSAGTAQPDGSFLAEPHWDTLNEQMIVDWGCFLPPDFSKFKGVSIFIRLGDGTYVKAPHSADDNDSPQQAGQAYIDSFAIDGDDVPKTPEQWTLIACSMNQYGEYNTDEAGNPKGPTVTLTTIAPNRGIDGGNVDPGALGHALVVEGPVIEFATTTPDNMVMNPDFEYGLEKWGYSGAAVVTSGAYTGTKAARIFQNAGYVSQRYFNVRPLDRLTLSAWVKCDAGTNGTLSLLVRGWNATLTQSTNLLSILQQPIAGWTKAGGSVEIPLDSQYTRIEVYISVSAMSAGAWYVDNVCLRREISLGGGLAYDQSGNLVIPDLGISREMLEAQIVGIDQLENAEIIKNAHIIRAGVNRLIVLDADIDTLRASKVSAGTLSALVIYSATINCNQINAGTLQAVNLYGGTLDLTMNGIRTLLNHGYSAIAGNYVGLTIYNAADGASPLYFRPGQMWCYENVNQVWDFTLQAYRNPRQNWAFETAQWIMFRPTYAQGQTGYGFRILRDVAFMGVYLYDNNDQQVVGLGSNDGGGVWAGAQYRCGMSPNNNKVVGPRMTGWTLPTGTPRRSGFNTGTATLQEIAETLCALIHDLHGDAGHGLIGA